MAPVDGLEELVQSWAVQVLAAPTRVSDDRDRAELTQLRIGPQSLRLAVDREALRRLLLG